MHGHALKGQAKRHLGIRITNYVDSILKVKIKSKIKIDKCI